VSILGRKRLAGKHSSLDIHGDYVRRHSGAVVHIRTYPGRSVSAGRGVRPHLSPNRIYTGKHRTRQTKHPATGQQHTGQRPTSVADRTRLVPSDKQFRTGNRRGRATASIVKTKDYLF